MRELLRLRTFAMLCMVIGLFAAGAASASAQLDVGTLVVNKFECDTVVTTTGGVDATVPLDCIISNADFSLDTDGDGSVDDTLVTVGGTGSAIVPAGTTTVVEDSTGFSTDAVVVGGEITTVNVLNPTAVDTGTGTLAVNKFECTETTETVGGVDFPVGADCTVGSADFSIDQTGDLLGDLDLTVVDGTGTIDLDAGDITLIEDTTGFTTDATIVSGETTSVNVLNPAGGAAATPAAPGGDTGGGDGDGTGNGGGGTTGGGTTGGGGTTAAAGGSVTTLPSTGQGSDTGSTGSIALVLGALSVVALAGGVAWRQRRLA